jgi:hypothetical protein
MKIETKTIERLRDAMLEEGRRETLVVSPAYEALARQGLLSSAETMAVSRIDPITETMFLMMAADGRITSEEVDVIWGAVRSLTNNQLRSGTIKVMLELYSEQLKRDGWKARLKAVTEQLAGRTRDRDVAFALAAAVALADLEVSIEENELVNRLAESFEISDERCLELFDLVKRDESPFDEDKT